MLPNIANIFKQHITNIHHGHLLELLGCHPLGSTTLLLMEKVGRSRIFQVVIPKYHGGSKEYACIVSINTYSRCGIKLSAKPMMCYIMYIMM